MPAPSHLAPRAAAIFEAAEATCLRLGLPPDEALEIANRAVSYAERGKRRSGTDAPIEFRARLESAKASSGGVRVYGYPSVVRDEAGALVVDHDGDLIPPSLLERAVANAIGAAVLDVDHRNTGKRGGDMVAVGRVIESAWLDADKRLAMGLPAEGLDGWWLGAEVTDPETIARFERGELREFSIRFLRHRVPLVPIAAENEQAKRLRDDDIPGLAVCVDLQILDVALVPEGAGRAVQVREARKSKTMNLEQIMAAIAALTAEQKAQLMAALQPAPPAEAEDGKGEMKDETPEQAKARAENEALKARLAAMEARSLDLEANIRRRDLTESVKERFAVPGTSTAKLVDLLVGVPAALRPAVEALAQTATEQAKALSRRMGAVGVEGGAPADFTAAYEAAKAKDPSGDPAKWTAAAKSAHPDLYASHYNRDA